MIRKHSLLLGFSLSAALLLTGCTSDLSQGGGSGEQPLRLSAAPTTGLTRAADGLYTQSSGFDGGEQVEVYVNGSSTHGTYRVNSTSKTGLDAVNAANTLYYPTTGDVNLYAVYPAASIASHTVKYDQTTEANYKASDLMYASKTVTQADKSNNQELQFGHQLVKLKVQIVKAADVGSVTKVEMQNVKRKVTVAANTSSMSLTDLTSASGETGTGADEDKILVFSGSNTQTSTQTYAVVFPVQEWADQDFITVTADGQTATYKLTKNDFTFGHEYTLTLNINARALGNTVSIDTWNNGGSAVINPTASELYIGAIGGKFSVAANKKVYFSQGNLRATYNGSSWTWSFAENQWDYIGNATGNTKVTGSSPFINENATVDLFGWVGASSTWTGAAQYGISSSTAIHNTNGYGNKALESLKSDWGNLAISNGGGFSNSGWFTLNIYEWGYVFKTRSTTSGVRYAKATVNGVSGVILLPDDWSTSYYSLASTNTGEAAYNTNSISSSDWSSKFEAHGAVFLPAAGYRNGTTVYLAGSDGSYWSTTATDGTDPSYCVKFSSSNFFHFTTSDRSRGFSVRLVRVAP